MQIFSFNLSILFVLTLNFGQATAAPNVAVSIQPIYSLAAAVMQGVGQPTLLVKGIQSPHTYMLRPSQAKLLGSSDLIVWVGPGLERFLEKPIASRSAKAKQLRLMDLKGLRLYSFRSGKNNGEIEEGHHGHHHRADSYDAHIWLDIDNAKIIAAAIADALQAVDPKNAAVYKANQTTLIKKLDHLHQALKARLAFSGNLPFMVFHDGYQYFEKAYNLKDIGSISLDPELQISAKRLNDIYDTIKQKNVRCLFAEVQFQTNLIERLAKKMKIKIGVLDPYGANLKGKPEDMYFTLMQNLASQFAGCLK